MIRWSVLIAGTVAATAAAFIAGAAVPTKDVKPPAEVKAEVAKPQVTVGQKTGYFNMAKVMREYRRAKTAVDRLNVRKERLSANIVGMKAMHVDLQAAARNATGPGRKEAAAEELFLLARQIEDMDRSLLKILNNSASVIIAELYDELHAVAAQVARDNGLTALLAYPDAVTAEEMENPLIKELKLKPPALQPFYLDASLEYSNEIIRRLNEKYDAENPN
jgi:hypothetical protein